MRKEGGMKTKRVTIHTLRKMKERGERISMLTAYDATFSRLLDQSQVDVLLVGDSLGMVIQGHETTLPVTLEDIIYHTRAVVRGTSRAHVVGDMPFMTYQSSVEAGLDAAGRLIKEGGAHSIKLEGGAQHVELVERLSSAGIPVMGHIGLTPQSVHQMGGFKIQGRGEGGAEELLADALALEKAGAYSIVLEGIPAEIATTISEALSIPTIGIGAGVGCDGQVLVIYDLLGMNEEFKPKFVRKYDNLALRIRTAVDAFVADVSDGTFPAEKETFYMDPKKRQPRQNAVVSAIAHAGGCAPEPIQNHEEPGGTQTTAQPSEPATPMYSTPKPE